MVMVAALALKETASIYEGALARPQTDVSPGYAAKLKAQVEVSERLVRARKIKAIHERAKISETFEALRAKGEISSEIEAELDGTIIAVGNQIKSHSVDIEEVEEESRALLERVKKLSPENFKVARKEIARFIESGKEMHADMVDMYYFLLSIKSELDHETETGRSFHNPDELKAFLDAELAE